MASVEKMTEGASIAASVEKVSAFTSASVPSGSPAPAILVHQDGPLSLTHVELALQETKEQREHRIRQLFAIFDTSKSGYLDHGHIEDVFRTLSIPAHNKYAKELLSVCDSNQDGKVDYDEFRKYMDTKELELYRIFQEIDVKHNGTIEPDELREALLRAGIPIQDDQLAMFVDHVDKDNNGIITFEEWRDFLLLLPNVKTLSNIYQYWEKICLVDIGEQAVIPEGISRQLDAYKYFFAGGVAGAVSRTATAPLDRLKVLLQVQTHDQGRGVMSGLAKIYKDSGFAGFFRGNGLNVFKVAPESAIKFYAYELLKEYVVKVDGSGTKEEIGTWGRFVAGGAAGAIAQTVIYPLDVVKTRLQTFCRSDGTAPPLMRLSHDMWVHEGPRAMYRGLVPSLLGMIPYAGIDLAAYETFKDLSRRFLPKDTEPGPLVQLTCGTVSGALGATCVYPLQLVRTRLQAQPMSSPNRYKGMGDCFRRTLKQEGLRGFYKGLAPNLLKVAPAASITYLVYEAMKKQFALNQK